MKNEIGKKEEYYKERMKILEERVSKREQDLKNIEQDQKTYLEKMKTENEAAKSTIEENWQNKYNILQKNFEDIKKANEDAEHQLGEMRANQILAQTKIEQENLKREQGLKEKNSEEIALITKRYNEKVKALEANKAILSQKNTEILEEINIKGKKNSTIIANNEKEIERLKNMINDMNGNLAIAQNKAEKYENMLKDKDIAIEVHIL